MTRTGCGRMHGECHRRLFGSTAVELGCSCWRWWHPVGEVEAVDEIAFSGAADNDIATDTNRVLVRYTYQPREIQDGARSRVVFSRIRCKPVNRIERQRVTTPEHHLSYSFNETLHSYCRSLRSFLWLSHPPDPAGIFT